MPAPVRTSRAPAPNGHYSQAMAAGGWLHLSMQLPLRPDGSMPTPLEDQVRQVVANCLAIVEAGGGDAAHIVSARFVTTDIANWQAIDRIWGEAMGEHRPARAILVVQALHLGALVGLELIAHPGRT